MATYTATVQNRRYIPVVSDRRRAPGAGQVNEYHQPPHASYYRVMARQLLFMSCVRLLRRFGLYAGILSCLQAAPDAREIIRRSVIANDEDWKALPRYSNIETDTTSKID